MIRFCKQLANFPAFGHGVLGVILVNAVMMGLETSDALVSKFGSIFQALNAVVQIIFVAEIGIRWLACWPRPLAFFKDGWNVFDFAVVSLSFMPVSGPFATVARLVRVLRVARLVHFSPDLKLIVGTMFRSLPSMGHVFVLIGLLLYIYGITGFHLFRANDPENWGTLARSMISLFEMVTLEGWVEFQDRAMALSPHYWFFFMSFIVFAVFVVVNLFIAVVINNLQTIKEEQRNAEENDSPLLDQIRDVQKKLAHIEDLLRRGS